MLHYCSTQLKVLTNVFCLEYCTKVLYVYSFMNVFLNPYTTTECNFCFMFVILFAILSTLMTFSRAFVTEGPLLLLYCNLYVLFVSRKNNAAFETSMNSDRRNAFFYLFKSPQWLSRKDCCPLLLHHLTFQDDLIELIFVL